MKIKSVKHNYIIKSLTLASSVLVPLISYPYVSRIIGPSGIGKVNFAQSVVYYFLIIAQLGIPTYGIRAVAKVRDDKDALSKTVQEIFFINLITCIISLFLLALTVNIVPQLKEEKLLMYCFALNIVFNTLSFDWMYFGLEQYDFTGITTISARLLSLILMLLLIKKPDDYILYGLLYVVCLSGYGILNFIHLPKVIIVKPYKNLNFKNHTGSIAVFFAMAIATTIYTQMDSVMLGFIKGTLENGYYDAAVKVKTVLVAFVTTLGGVMLPRSSYCLEKGEKEKFYDMSSKALNFVLLVSVPCTLFFILFAYGTVMFLSGSEFLNSVMPMKYIMPSLVLIGITGITGIQMMVPLGREKQVLYSEIAGAVVNLVVNALLIPKMGASGAAIGTVAAEFCVLVVQFIAIRKDIGTLIKEIEWIKLIAACLAAALAAFKIQSIFLGAPVFFAVYLLALIIMKESMVTDVLSHLKDRIKNK